jgi:hypothetical protein
VPTRGRLEKNERLFREVNERIREVGERFSDELTRFDFFCECADFTCTQRLTLALREYESVRAHPARFAVLPGHELPELERIVERNERYVVVEKPGLLESPRSVGR